MNREEKIAGDLPAIFCVLCVYAASHLDKQYRLLGVSAAAGNGFHEADGGALDAKGPLVEERRDHVAELCGHVAHVAAMAAIRVRNPLCT